MPDDHPALGDVQGLTRLLLQLDAALQAGDRDRALELLNRVRELSRHACALVRNYRRAEG
jgi:signal transduction histidine kinase